MNKKKILCVLPAIVACCLIGYGLICYRESSAVRNFGSAIRISANFVSRLIMPMQDLKDDPGLSDWMGDAYHSSNPMISTISMPGTHDSFTFSISRGPIGWFTGKTQMYDIKSQWDLGVRCFDVRIDKMNWVEQFVTRKQNSREYDLGIFHGPVFLEKPLIKGISEIVEMVVSHPTETAIIILKFEGDETDEYKSDVDEILRKFKSHIVTDAGPNMRLNDCRGKVIIIRRYQNPEAINHYIYATGWDEDSDNRLIFNDAATTNNEAKLYVQDLYEQGSMELDEYFRAKKEAIDKCFIGSADNNGDTWYFNHQSGYIGVIDYAHNASVTTPFMVDYLNSPQMEGKHAGIVMLDFAGYKGRFGVKYDNIDCLELPEIIIRHN